MTNSIEHEQKQKIHSFVLPESRTYMDFSSVHATPDNPTRVYVDGTEVTKDLSETPKFLVSNDGIEVCLRFKIQLMQTEKSERRQ